MRYEAGVHFRGLGEGIASCLAAPAAPSDPSVSKTRLPSVLVCNDGHFRHPAQWRGAGVSAPLFSLRSRRSLGCGDMGDLCKLVDMCNSCGFKILQLLPINDTSVYRTWRDSYPYACSEQRSAGHPAPPTLP